MSWTPHIIEGGGDDDDPVQGEFVYGGKADPNSGYAAGSPSSEERARTEDRTGVTGIRQREVLRLLAHRGENGLTWRELGDAQGWHHGQSSGALSGLHKAGRIARLSVRRGRCAVYVLPEHVSGRATEVQGHSASTELLHDAREILESITERCSQHAPFVDFECRWCRAVEWQRRYDNTFNQ